MHMLIRMMCAYALCALISFAVPGWWLNSISPLVELVANATSPFLESTSVRAEVDMLHLEGQVLVNMTLRDGTPLPPLPGQWKKTGGHTLNILILAAAIWAAPVASIRRRLCALPVMLLAAALVSSLDLAVEMQVSSLQVIGSEWLPGLELASSAENVDAFRKLERWYESVRWIKGFNDGGGRLFLAVIAGLIGYTRPISYRRNRPLPPGNASKEKHLP